MALPSRTLTLLGAALTLTGWRARRRLRRGKLGCAVAVDWADEDSAYSCD